MSSIRLRPDIGRLYFDFHYRGIRCREYSSLSDTLTNRRKMEAVLKKIEADISLGTFEYKRYFPNSKMVQRFELAAANIHSPSSPATIRSATPLFTDFVQTWLQDKQVEWRRSYTAAVESILQTHLLPFFGTIPVGDIDRSRIMTFRSQLASIREVDDGARTKQRAAATVNRIMGILKQILDESVARHGGSNPSTGVKQLKVKRVEIEPFSIDEVRKIIDVIRPDYRQYITVRFFTGMRSGEAHGLRWKHIDFNRRQILVRETYQHGHVEYTKTDGSQREIDMSGPVHEALRAHCPSEVDPESYVFRTKNGMPLDNKNFNNRVWKPLLRYLGITMRRPYQMRHTCATLWMASGENPEWVARQLGHTSTQMLFQTYSRYVPNLTRRDGSAFDRLVTNALNGGLNQENSNEK
jgi:integrase